MDIETRMDRTAQTWAKNPIRKTIEWSLYAVAISLTIKLLVWPLMFAGQAVDVAQKEFAPAAMLRKYEWFKDASASLVKQEHNLVAYRARIESFQHDYAGVSKAQWPRDDRQAYNQLHAEYQGMLQIYNDVAAQYNAQSNKFNWAAFDATDGDQVVQQFKIYSPINQ